MSMWRAVFRAASVLMRERLKFKFKFKFTLQYATLRLPLQLFLSSGATRDSGSRRRYAG